MRKLNLRAIQPPTERRETQTLRLLNTGIPLARLIHTE